jgi:hypothetical protein
VSVSVCVCHFSFEGHIQEPRIEEVPCSSTVSHCDTRAGRLSDSLLPLPPHHAPLVAKSDHGVLAVLAQLLNTLLRESSHVKLAQDVL